MRVISEGPVKITRLAIEAAWKRRAEGQRLIVRDSLCRGLALIVNATAWRWEVAYRPRGFDPASRRRWGNRTVTIGTPQSHGVDAARVEAGRLKGVILAGGDPRAERRAAIGAQRAAEAAVEARAE